MRASLSALGISIGIAAIVGVLGISQSSKTGLLNELGQLGNLLTVQPASTAFGQPTELPTTAEGMVSRIGPVTNVTEIGSHRQHLRVPQPLRPGHRHQRHLADRDRRRPARHPRRHRGPRHLPQRGHRPLPGGRPRRRDGQPARHQQPGQPDPGVDRRALVHRRGHLEPGAAGLPDGRMAFIGFPIAEQYFGFDGHPTGLYLRSVPSQVNAVAAVLPATVNPANPSIVAVS